MDFDYVFVCLEIPMYQQIVTLAKKVKCTNTWISQDKHKKNRSPSPSNGIGSPKKVTSILGPLGQPIGASSDERSTCSKRRLSMLKPRGYLSLIISSLGVYFLLPQRE